MKLKDIMSAKGFDLPPKEELFNDGQQIELEETAGLTTVKVWYKCTKGGTIDTADVEEIASATITRK